MTQEIESVEDGVNAYVAAERLVGIAEGEPGGMPWFDVYADYRAWTKGRRLPVADLVAFKQMLLKARPEWTRRKVRTAGLVFPGLSVRRADGARPMHGGQGDPVGHVA